MNGLKQLRPRRGGKDDRGKDDRSKGQVLPLFALFLLVLLGFAALAVDVGRAYADLRLYRAAADAASLAGAQDLQIANTRTVTSSEQTQARTHALASLVSRLGGSSAGCTSPTSNIVDCPLGGSSPFVVSIKTPSPTCSACSPTRSVQVTIRHPNYGLTFARALGSSEWDLGTTSVSGLVYAAKYAVVTLRPPQPLPNGLDQNRQDIDVNGNNTVVNVVRGDVGTNTSAYTNSGGTIKLGSGYTIDHIDNITPDPWNKDLAGNPTGRLITRLIQDPDYRVAAFAGVSPFANQNAGKVSCAGRSDFPTDYLTVLVGAQCYLPGVYSANFNVGTGGQPNIAYLLPGAFRFAGGLDVRHSLLGGLISNQPGVVLVVPQNRTFTANNAVKVWLNIGREGCVADTCRASAAVATNGLIATPAGFVISIEVPRDNACFSGQTPRLCADAGNNTIRLPGNGQLAVAGVIYAPSDNVQVNGDNSLQTGLVGQLYTWTARYSGGAKLNQDYPGGTGNGILRIDAACSAPSEPCNP